MQLCFVEETRILRFHCSEQIRLKLLQHPHQLLAAVYAIRHRATAALHLLHAQHASQC